MMMYRYFAIILFLQVFLTHCGPADLATPEESQSMLHYIPFGTTNGISLRYAREPVFKICATGQSNAKVEQWAIRAVLTWLKAARTIDDKVTRTVEISCNSPHVTINMIPGKSVSYAGPGQVKFFTGQLYGELLHELGHALAGLSDTYTGRQAGACRSGQPQSNMCWGAYGPRANPEQFSGLWPDDIAGVQNQHRSLFRDAVPPANAAEINPELPVDASNPWPEVGQDNKPDESNKIWVALSESNTDQSKIYLNVPASAQTVIVCLDIDDAQECKDSDSKVAFQTTDLDVERSTFVSANLVSISAQQTWHAFAFNQSDKAIAQQGFRFAEK